MVSIRLFADRDPVLDWRQLLAANKDGEFKNLTRSSVVAFAYWRWNASSALESLGFRGDVSLHFEYTVPSLGRAPSSHTDLMALSESRAVGVEAKSTEPRPGIRPLRNG